MAGNGGQHPRIWRAATRIAGVVALTLSALTWVVTTEAAPVAAQATCTYPAYENCTTPTTDADARRDPTLAVGMNVVAAGQVFAVEGCLYDPGVPVTFTFGGRALETVNADADGCAPASLTTPNVAPGSYEVCGVAAGYRTVCRSIEVAGTSVDRTAGDLVGATGSSGTSGSSGRLSGAGSLARSGAGVLTLLSVAALTIAVGCALKRRSARRLFASKRRARRARSGYVV